MRKTQRAGTTEDPHGTRLHDGPAGVCSLHSKQSIAPPRRKSRFVTARIVFGHLLHRFLHPGSSSGLTGKVNGYMRNRRDRHQIGGGGGRMGAARWGGGGAPT